MKKLIISFFVFHFSFFIFHSVCAQWGCSCLPEGITFTTQSQIDSFQVNYPGCTEIEGDVTINGYDITNLNGFNVLTSIGGYLEINYNNALTSLTGLEGVTSIGGDLSITWTELTDLTGLNNLVSLGGNITIGGNNSLINLTGLEGLTFVPGSIVLYVYMDNGTHGNSLQNLHGLDNLITIGGDLDIKKNSLTDLTGLNSLTTLYNLILGGWSFHGGQGNGSLLNLNGLENLTTIYGNLFLGGNGILSLEGPVSLTSIGGDLVINENYSLNTITGLDNLAYIGGNLTVTNNPSLLDCEAEYICEYLSNPIGSINIYNNAGGCNNPVELADNCGITLSCLPYGNYYFISQADIDDFGANYPGCFDLGGDVTINGPDISDLSGLEQVTSIDGNLVIGRTYTMQGHNPLLCSLAGLENLTQVSGNLNIIYNDSLRSLTGLNNLISVGGNLWVIWNEVLESLSLPGELSFVGGDLYIRNNAALEDLAGMESLASIGGNFTIEGNPNLDSLTGMENLQNIGGAFEIKWSPVKNMTGLESMNSIGGDLFLYNCNSLTSLSDLGNLNTIGGSFRFDQTALTDLEGLGNLHSIGCNLEIGIWEGNPNLVSLNGLQNLDSIGGTLAIRHSHLTNLSGLENIDPGSITNLSIIQNYSLTNCEVESICSYLSSPNGIVWIHDNNEGCQSPFHIAHECGITLPCLPNGYYHFNSQEDINDFVAYSDCTELAGDVIISGYDITDLSGLSRVTSIGGELNVNLNPYLAGLSGLDNISAGSIANLSIYNNYSLSSCEVQSVCDYLTSPTGWINIYGNETGCGSTEQVLDACAEVGIEPVVGGQRLAVSCFPNPTSGIVDFRWSIFDGQWTMDNGQS